MMGDVDGSSEVEERYERAIPIRASTGLVRYASHSSCSQAPQHLEVDITVLWEYRPVHRTSNHVIHETTVRQSADMSESD